LLLLLRTDAALLHTAGALLHTAGALLLVLHTAAA
jgi:hypothetical protein